MNTAGETTQNHVVVVMGVAGTGKTTVGRLLAEDLDVPYAEADAFHPPANVAKMSAGTPLDDTDRAPWLDAIGAWAHDHAEHGGVVSCSALKRAYRDRLRAAAPHLVFVHLTGDRALIGRRMAERADHFMPVALLDSQFATLEPLQADERGVSVSVAPGPRAVARRALAALRSAHAPVPSPLTTPEGAAEAPTGAASHA
ncbi:gluconokinase [Streptomyces tubbatahanensis]|uniref:Gluconokinase n=1 Tax=Streptomyces tubbatahanensis TaxID=2923272 RepID=A0ABY3XU58_9ACTN|nr:gluconokinase [Streptomyces tubbatahanensis]UNS98007.1 gluconokinase [Streptomyces tubbatahanensis]